PHPEPFRESALHHIQRQRLNFQIGHQRLDAELNSDLEQAMQATKLSKSDLARLSIERGLKIVLKQLTMEVAA
ncbi:MAG: hypothetical protein Q8M07_13430, partial [Prosthecobacter sp.]|nr:hypothetical protein [Prosthecobacter sp.]